MNMWHIIIIAHEIIRLETRPFWHKEPWAKVVHPLEKTTKTCQYQSENVKHMVNKYIPTTNQPKSKNHSNLQTQHTTRERALKPYQETSAQEGSNTLIWFLKNKINCRHKTQAPTSFSSDQMSNILIEKNDLAKKSTAEE